MNIESINKLIEKWEVRRLQYEQERSDAMRENDYTGRMSAADLWGELGACIHELKQAIKE